jgi:hypothetical protein
VTNLISVVAHLVFACLVIIYAGCGRDNGPMLPTGLSDHAAKWIEVKDGQYPPSSLQISDRVFSPDVIIAIAFSLPEPGIVTLTICDCEANEVVKPLNREVIDAGLHEVEWNSSNLGSGVYVFTLAYQKIDQNGRPIAGITTMGRKMMLLK